MTTRADRDERPARTREDTPSSWRGTRETRHVGIKGIYSGVDVGKVFSPQEAADAAGREIAKTRRDIDREFTRVGRYFTEEGFYDDGLVAHKSDIEYHVGLDPRRFVWVYDDFLGSNTNAMAGVYGFVPKFTGTGAQVAPTTGSSTRPGVCQATTGTTTTGRAAMASSASMMSLGGGVVRWVSALQVATLSASLNRYIVYTGLLDSVSTNPTDGVYFQYSDNLTSGNWRCVTVSNGTSTVADSGVSVATATWYDFEIRINSDGTKADFFIDHVPVGGITTNIPTGAGRELGLCACNIRKTVGTTARTLDCDYAGINVILREPR